MTLERQGLFFAYAVPYVAAHSDLTLDFVVTDDILADFKRFLKEKHFTYSTALEVDLDDLKEKVAEEHKDSLFADALARLDLAAERDKEDDFDISRDYIRQALQRTIIRNKFGERGVYEQVILKEDPAIQEALRVLRSKEQYQKLLSGPAGKGKTDQG